jgi:hypothetical protein
LVCEILKGSITNLVIFEEAKSYFQTVQVKRTKSESKSSTMSQDLEPHVNLNRKRDNAISRQHLIPDTLYRLRLSVLRNSEGQSNCPSRVFVGTLRYYKLSCSGLLTAAEDFRVFYPSHRGDW